MRHSLHTASALGALTVELDREPCLYFLTVAAVGEVLNAPLRSSHARKKKAEHENKVETIKQTPFPIHQ